MTKVEGQTNRNAGGAPRLGPEHATMNYGFLYMAQGVGSVLGGPLAAYLHVRFGSWLPVFYVIVGLDLLTAALALLVLKPMRARWLASGASVAEAETPAPAALASA